MCISAGKFVLPVPCRIPRSSPLSLIKPFRALRPAPGRAAEVLAPPYDVLSSAEARERAEGKPWSFLHVSKAEIDLPPATDPYDPAVYAKAAENLRRMIEAGVLVRDAKACYYVYRLTWRGHVETGFAAVASIADYASEPHPQARTDHPRQGRRPRPPDRGGQRADRAGHARLPDRAADRRLAGARRRRRADVDVTADDDVRHQLWVVADDATIAALTAAVDALPALYIADGHHRSAAALRVAQARGGEGSHSYFLAVLLPQQQMTILDYNRVLRDLNGHYARAGFERTRAPFHCRAERSARAPAAADEVGMVLGGRWYRLTLRPELAAAAASSADPVAKLPVTLVAQEHHRADLRRHRSAPRQAHRLRRRRPRPRGAGAAGRVGSDGGRVRALPDADERPHGGRRRRRDHAAEIDLVRTQARRRHGQPRAGMSWRRSANGESRIGIADTISPSSLLRHSPLRYSPPYGAKCRRSRETPAVRSRPVLASTERGCSAIERCEPPTSALAPSPAPTETSALAPT